MTTTSSRQRKLLESQLSESKIKYNQVTDSIASLDIKILDQQIGNESARELGPLKYMAQLTNKPMETIVNWFMIFIIFVFDPLAIAMVIAANMAFNFSKKDKSDIYINNKRKTKAVPKNFKKVGLEQAKVVEMDSKLNELYNFVSKMSDWKKQQNK